MAGWPGPSSASAFAHVTAVHNLPCGAGTEGLTLRTGGTQGRHSSRSPESCGALAHTGTTPGTRHTRASSSLAKKPARRSRQTPTVWALITQPRPLMMRVVQAEPRSMGKGGWRGRGNEGEQLRAPHSAGIHCWVPDVPSSLPIVATLLLVGSRSVLRVNVYSQHPAVGWP